MELTQAKWLRILYLKEKGVLKLSDQEINKIYHSGKIKKKYLNKIREAHASQLAPQMPNL